MSNDAPQFKEIARFPGGLAIELHASLERETEKAKAAGWTQISVTLADFHLVLLGIPPTTPVIP